MRTELNKINEDTDDIELDAVDISEYDDRLVALAMYFEEDPSSVRVSEYDDKIFVLPDNREYLVLTDQEADDEFDSRVDSMMDELEYSFDPDYLVGFLYSDAFDDEYDSYAYDRVADMDDDDVIEEAEYKGLIDTDDEDFDRDSVDIESLKEQLADEIRREFSDSTDWAKDYYSSREIIEMISHDLESYLDLDAIREDIIWGSSRADYIGGDGREIELPLVNDEGEQYYAYRL